MALFSGADLDSVKYLKKFSPTEAEKLGRRLFSPVQRYFRAQIIGTENIPSEPFIGVGIHGGASFLPPDALLWLSYYHAYIKRPPLVTLSHDLFDRTGFIITSIMQKMGVVPARPAMARTALAEGFAVMVYPGGDVDASRSIWNRNKIKFANNKGYIRLALESGAPIVPIVSIGAVETKFVLWDGEAIARFLKLDSLFRLNTLPISYKPGKGLGLGYDLFNVPLPAQITISVLPPRPFNDFLPEDAKNETIVDSLDTHVRGLMQQELDKLAQKRLPFWGKKEKNTVRLPDKKDSPPK